MLTKEQAGALAKRLSTEMWEERHGRKWAPPHQEEAQATSLQGSSPRTEASTPASSASSVRPQPELNEAFRKQNALIEQRNKVARKAAEEMSKRPFSQQQYDEYKASIYWTDNQVPPPGERLAVRQAYERKYGKHKSGS